MNINFGSKIKDILLSVVAVILIVIQSWLLVFKIEVSLSNMFPIIMGFFLLAICLSKTLVKVSYNRGSQSLCLLQGVPLLGKYVESSFDIKSLKAVEYDKFSKRVKLINKDSVIKLPLTSKSKALVKEIIDLHPDVFIKGNLDEFK